MKAHYTFRFTQELVPDDHWPIELHGVRYELLEADNGRVSGLRVTLSGLDPSSAPSVTPTPDQQTKLHINFDDEHRQPVEQRVRRAFAYVRCYENVEIDFTDVDVRYEAENDHERDQMEAFGLRAHRNTGPDRLTWNYITRALATPETDDDPEFAATLLATARSAYFKRKYVTSFRFAFLMFDGLYGGGKFRSKALLQAFLASDEFMTAVRQGLADTIGQRFKHTSPTTELLSTHPTVERVVQHLIDRRGHYFHGNRRKPDAWHPEREEEAEALAPF